MFEDFRAVGLWVIRFCFVLLTRAGMFSKHYQGADVAHTVSVHCFSLRIYRNDTEYFSGLHGREAGGCTFRGFQGGQHLPSPGGSCSLGYVLQTLIMGGVCHTHSVSALLLVQDVPRRHGALHDGVHSACGPAARHHVVQVRDARHAQLPEAHPGRRGPGCIG